jgi:DNA-directed RNA polymerase subunit RPC12/RpoP
MEKATCKDRLYCPDCHDETTGEMPLISPGVLYPNDYAQPAEYGEPVCMFCGCETLMDYVCSQCPSRDSLTEVEGTLYCPDCRPVKITVTVKELDLMIMSLEFVADWGGVNVNVPEADEKTRELINKLYHVGDNLDLLLTRSRKPVEPEPQPAYVCGLLEKQEESNG